MADWTMHWLAFSGIGLCLTVAGQGSGPMPSDRQGDALKSLATSSKFPFASSVKSKRSGRTYLPAWGGPLWSTKVGNSAAYRIQNDGHSMNRVIMSGMLRV
ncbi:hypothetical protein V1517DRAFT_317814, partial [Lipomyces orientalis]